MAERTPLNLPDRTAKLLKLIEDDGMVNVYRRSDLSLVDRGILSLLAGFATLKGARELSEILRTQDPRKPRKYAIRGADFTTTSDEKTSSSQSSSSKPASPGSAGEGEKRS